MLVRTVDKIDALTPTWLKRLLKKWVPDIESRVYRIVQSFTADKSSQVTILRGPLQGRPFICNLRRERDYCTGLWEPDLVSRLKEQVREGDVVYDVGCHTGYMTLILSLLVGDKGLVHGFEPNPDNVKLIDRNLRLNEDLALRITMHPVAVSGCVGQMHFVANGESATGFLVSGSIASEKVIAVNTTSIDDSVAAGLPPPNVIKMDIEGGEHLAIPGMYDTLKTYRPTLFIEIHDLKSWKVFLDAVDQFNYRVEALDGRSVHPNSKFTERSQFLMVPSGK